MRCLYNPYNALGRGFSRQFFQVFLACLYRIDPNSWKLLKKALVFKTILVLFLFGSAQSYAQIIIAADNANNYSAGNPWINTAMGVLGLAHGQLPPELEEAIFWEIPQMQE